ncbi:MAG: type II toxin-antitoxin system HipA family toxin [Rhodoferax sp.]|nr:type II toxin-antitoxin system HipA family toxin [Rhodoferax sp.]MDP3651095.1 type II toxin-antitoxin system HipA family toxin [Rhodoferax sp.]
MKKLNVFFCGWGQRWLLGTLADNGTDLLFEYSPEALAQGLELSPRTLKLRPQAYGDFPAHQHRLPGLVADALPDGWGLLLMDRLLAQQGIERSQISPLDRLAFLGERTMGALVFAPASEGGLPQADLDLLALAREAKAVVAGKESAALRQLVLLGGSPHGARPKVLVQYDAATGHVSTADTGPGTPWLVKFQAQNEHKEVCAMEQLYAQLARSCLLEMPRTQYFDLGHGLAAFGTERFDRFQGMRVPVHTLAGALNLNFREARIGYQTLLRATQLLTQSAAEVKKAFERCVFNVVFNNRDDHAKNFSFRMDERLHWKLAPCYDLTYNEGPGGEHQMDIEGEGRAPTKAHLLRLASTNSLEPTWAAQVIDRMADAAGNFTTLAKDYAIRPATRNTMAKAIARNCLRMA